LFGFLLQQRTRCTGTGAMCEEGKDCLVALFLFEKERPMQFLESCGEKGSEAKQRLNGLPVGNRDSCGSGGLLLCVRGLLLVCREGGLTCALRGGCGGTQRERGNRAAAAERPTERERHDRSSTQRAKSRVFFRKAIHYSPVLLTWPTVAQIQLLLTWQPAIRFSMGYVFFGREPARAGAGIASGPLANTGPRSLDTTRTIEVQPYCDCGFIEDWRDDDDDDVVCDPPKNTSFTM